MISQFLFIGFPYAMLFLFFAGTILRYRFYGYSVSSLSSQIMESRLLYWGSRLFHIGIIMILAGHLIGLLLPSVVISITQGKTGLYLVEGLGFSMGWISLAGLAILVYRRVFVRRLHAVTNRMDAIVYALLLGQVVTGLLIAYLHRWGASWYASSLVPYLLSLLFLRPDILVIETMPLLVQFHAIGAFLFIGLIPFTRLMHFIVYPFQYFFRRPIVFVWNVNLSAMRSSRNMRAGVKPKNN